MRRTLGAPALFLLLALSAWSLTLQGSSVSASPVGFLSVSGTSIVDANNATVTLRGVNYPGYEDDRSSYYPPLHSATDYARFAGLGFNVVRLPISWAYFEPRNGSFNWYYLTHYVDYDIQLASNNGIRLILNLHQMDWGEDFGGYGVPLWATQQYPHTDSGMIEAASNFWVNSSLQEQFISVWVKIARYYANDKTIAGYDLLNEPWIYTSVIHGLNGSYVNAFYQKAISAIRTVDTNHIIFLEPANMYVAQRFPDKDLVWSPHFYSLAYNSHFFPENITVLKADLEEKYQLFVVQTGTPMWIGEFGAYMTDGSSRQWLMDATQLFSSYHIGWAWWAVYDGSGMGAIVSESLVAISTG